MLMAFGIQAKSQTDLLVRNGTGCDAIVLVGISSFGGSTILGQLVPGSGCGCYTFTIPAGYYVCYVKGDVYPYSSTDFYANNPYGSCGSSVSQTPSNCFNSVDGFTPIYGGTQSFSFH